MNGTQIVSLEEAITLAAISAQIQFGDHDESRHKKGFLEFRDLIPCEYRMVPGLERKIFTEHKKLIGLTALDGKMRYIDYCRKLKTYGVTFFLVKEKLKGDDQVS